VKSQIKGQVGGRVIKRLSLPGTNPEGVALVSRTPPWFKTLGGGLKNESGYNCEQNDQYGKRIGKRGIASDFEGGKAGESLQTVQFKGWLKSQKKNLQLARGTQGRRRVRRMVGERERDLNEFPDLIKGEKHSMEWDRGRWQWGEKHVTHRGYVSTLGGKWDRK